MAGLVRVDGRAVDKPGTGVAEDADLDVRQDDGYVSRGGLKLAGALDAFGVDVARRRRPRRRRVHRRLHRLPAAARGGARLRPRRRLRPARLGGCARTRASGDGADQRPQPGAGRPPGAAGPRRPSTSPSSRSHGLPARWCRCLAPGLACHGDGQAAVRGGSRPRRIRRGRARRGGAGGRGARGHRGDRGDGGPGAGHGRLARAGPEGQPRGVRPRRGRRRERRRRPHRQRRPHLDRGGHAGQARPAPDPPASRRSPPPRSPRSCRS